MNEVSVVREGWLHKRGKEEFVWRLTYFGVVVVGLFVFSLNEELKMLALSLPLVFCVLDLSALLPAAQVSTSRRGDPAISS